ncbi:hypothetical protein GCM10009740_07690 [Terrabacter terrae]|uniref:Uncharacterized protein n=1 Tax=Terrabacter terrae TaxID=318434 RepID=A0ABP5FC68_9MICO
MNSSLGGAGKPARRSGQLGGKGDSLVAEPTLTAYSITDKERNLKDLFKNCHLDGMLFSVGVSARLYTSGRSLSEGFGTSMGPLAASAEGGESSVARTDNEFGGRGPDGSRGGDGGRRNARCRRCDGAGGRSVAA